MMQHESCKWLIALRMTDIKKNILRLINSTATLCTLRFIPIGRIMAKKAAKLQNKLADPTLQFIKILVSLPFNMLELSNRRLI